MHIIETRLSLYYIGDTRLVNGSRPNEGRLEIYYDGVWGTVCDNGFDSTDADVVCRELGYPGSIGYFCCAYYGQGSGPIWLSDLGCTGAEESVSNCTHNGFGNHDCTHSEDVGVQCQGNYSTLVAFYKNNDNALAMILHL